MQPKPNIAFCPNCRTPKSPNEVTCSHCGTRACPSGHPMSSKICSLCGWEDRSWRPQARSYSPVAPLQRSQEVPDARESVCPKCKVRSVFTSGRCLNCGYILETGQSGGTQQKAASSVPQSGSTFPPEMQHHVVQQQFPGVHDAKREYVCPRCGAKADPRAGNCQNCGYIGSLEYEIAQQQVPGGAPPAPAAASVRQQNFVGQQFVRAQDMSQSRACPSCGADIPYDSKFCQRCGKPSGSGRPHEKLILATDRAVISGVPMAMGQVVPSMDTAYAAESFQGSMGTFMPGADDISISEREFPEERIRTKKTKEKGYPVERKGFPKGLLVAIFVVAAALVAMVMFTVSQITSSPSASTPTPTVDKIPPEISEVTFSTVTGSSAIVEWTTDEKATSQIMLCDPSGVCTWTEPDATLAKSHSVQVDNIKINVTYHVTVKSMDTGGNESSSETDHTFTTESQPDTTPVGPEVGKRAPDFTLKNLAGDDVTLSSFKGKIVMVNFWATTCAPCVAELPYIEAVYKDRAGSVVVLAVNAGESEAIVQSFIDDSNFTFPVLLDLNSVARVAYNVSSWPKTFFIDTTGIIREIEPLNFTNRAEIDTILNTLQ